MPSAVPSRSARAISLRRRIADHPAFILPRDFTLFLRGARTDNAIKLARASMGARAAFEAAYTSSADPWSSAAPRYRYQSRKYDQIIALLPDRHFGNVLDLGCGIGLLSRRLAQRANHVLGLDVAAAALVHARRLTSDLGNVGFDQGDILDLPTALDGCFDLVVIADTLYYLDPLTDEMLKALSTRMAALLRPGGVCVLANHFFFSADAESRVSRRIHDAFTWSPSFTVIRQHRRAFFLVSLLSGPPLHHQSLAHQPG
ncbi:class I SAM-dependent DNA methyltransferase [Lichenicoccus sp.]|uniref:class I SAM-dependent DNA methyltransferase n=1 Tax=Lichenicoccus sp. TaxID=2781899 RepID=UPI003D0ED839